jgi:O-antigen biosynthesis protein
MNNFEASLVVPIFNGLRFLPSFWDSLLRNVGDACFELIIVNDASTEPVLTTLPTLPTTLPITVLTNHSQQGYAASINRGMAQSSGDYIIHLNNDLVLQPNSLRSLLTTIKEHPRAGIVGAKLIYPQTGLIQHTGMAFSDSNKFHIFHHMPANHALASKSRLVQCSTGAILCIRRDAYHHIGQLDESFLNCNEDVDYCLRAKQAGYDIVVDAHASAYHWESQSGPIRFVRAVENDAIFWGKWLRLITADIRNYLIEGISFAINKPNAPEIERCEVLNLSKGQCDRYVLEAIWSLASKPQPKSAIDFRQLGNASSIYWLPMLLPHSMISAATPFIYIVDTYLSLVQNNYWFEHRLKVVGEELIIDHTGCAFLTTEILSVGHGNANILV